ncbi:hypothetical protein LTR36_002615 [Oleoguttula mirabilis]|uniref:GH64 domain-containing protein n=1 Tax=Oleoguttula mirabilis TaxID=1507867 RepID=A0AAV9JK34_9PEZI|nr:hypothetical protein LTR36_002615 [Oleoguttula mirabilis]
MAAPIVMVHPGGVDDIVITNQDTLNATRTAPANATSGSTNIVEDVASTASSKLPLAFVNNFAGSINAYVTGLDPEGQLVFLQADGTWFYPTADTSQSAPVEISANLAIALGGQGSTTSISLPDYISSGRIYFANGDLHFYTVWSTATNGPGLVQPSSTNPEDPNAGTNWGFVELTNSASELYADLSYLDFVGLPLGLSLTVGDGSTQTAEGVSPAAVSSICSALVAQTAVDGQPWGDLCQEYDGEIIRVIGPQDYISLNPDAFGDYFTDYVNQVWTYYETNTLTIDTQASAGSVACTVQNGLLQCDGDNRGYAQPVANDIFGCNSGPFAIESGDNNIHVAVVPRLCAAFDRSTLLLTGGDVQPSLDASNFYTTAPTNYFSKLVHEQEMDGKGYAFAYDDVVPDSGADQSGKVVDADPQLLSVIVGGSTSYWA